MSGNSKKEMIGQAAEQAGVTLAAARRVIEAFVDQIGKDLATNGRVRVENLGVFELVESAPHEGRNPRTGERVQVPARRRARYSPALSVKRLLAV